MVDNVVVEAAGCCVSPLVLTGVLRPNVGVVEPISPGFNPVDNEPRRDDEPPPAAVVAAVDVGSVVAAVVVVVAVNDAPVPNEEPVLKPRPIVGFTSGLTSAAAVVLVEPASKGAAAVVVAAEFPRLNNEPVVVKVAWPRPARFVCDVVVGN